MVKRNPSSRGGTASSSSSSSLHPSQTSGALQKLNMLRDFVGSTSYSETDLTACLRQCGFNVERAAELLITGQFEKEPAVRKKNAKSAFFQTVSNEMRTTMIVGGGGGANGVPAIPKCTSTKRQSKIREHSTSGAAAASSSSRKRPPVSVTPKTPAATTTTTIHDGDDEDDGTLFRRRTATTTTTPVSAGSNNSSNQIPPPPPPGGRLLLCRRWLSDAIVTSRKGRVVYQERLDLDHSLSGFCSVRFRGERVEGRLPENVALILCPLLRRRTMKKNDKSSPTSSSIPLLFVQAEALMSDTRLESGMSTPIQLTIYLQDPLSFFELMQGGSEQTESKSAAFFQTKQQQSNGTTKRGIASKNMTPAEAAFHLLQYAEYGDTPVYEVAAPTAAAAPTATTASDESTRRKESSVLNNVKVEDDDDDDDDDTMELHENDFEDAASVDGVSVQGEQLAATATLGDAQRMATLAEAEAPAGLADHMTLRSYQKQALHFMMQRERSTGANRDELEEQLQLLQELSNEQGKRNGTQSTGIQPDQMSREIVCDCGPVQVSTKGISKSTTLDGVVDPVNHPLWKRRFLSSPCMTRSVCFYVNELLGVATHRAPNPPKACSGGVLADAMGLGKTVMLMALILKSKEERKPLKGAPSTTLVVAKLSLLPQWEDELKTKTNLTYRIYYGPGKSLSMQDLEDVDVVVTTYGSIQGELRTKNSVVLQCDWLRVILDEAHCIRNQRTLASKVCCKLKAEHRWAVSGTIIQNSLDDVFGIMKFLQHEPWCWASFWNTAVTMPTNVKNDESELDPLLAEESLATALDRVRRLLSPIMIRRTKDSVTQDGKPILVLPPIEAKTITVHLSETEREFYNAVLARSLEVFDNFVKDGTATSAYFQIFSLLQRLRQVCDHIALTVKSQLNEDEWLASEKTEKPAAKHSSTDSSAIGQQFLEGLLQKFCGKQMSPRKEKKRHTDEPVGSAKRARENYASTVAHSLSQAVTENSTHVEEECAICLEPIALAEAVVTPCAHLFCRGCLIGAFRQAAKISSAATTEKQQKFNPAFNCPDGVCPTCNKNVEAKKVIELSKSGGNGSMTTKYLTENKPSSFVTTKLRIKETSEGNPQGFAKQILQDAVSGNASSKMHAVLDELNAVWKLDPGSKVLIFSHYLGFLDLLQSLMDANDIPFFRLDGSLNLKERMNVLQAFRESKKYKSNDGNVIQKGTVLLMSMGAGGEGLNIVAASSCFILEPWWNGAKEDQCVNRVHRIGQDASIVRVRKFIVEDTVEERIVELQKRKSYIAGEIYSDAGRTGDMGSAKLSLEDFRLIFRSS